VGPNKRNLQLPELVDRLLDDERDRGPTIKKTVCAALYWYFNRLEAQQRELARVEAQQWLETGMLPSSDIASEMETALRAAKARAEQQSRQQSKVGK
jgi:hypothetical protein